MATTAKKTPIKGGRFARNAKTGRFIAVGSSGKTYKSGPKTHSTIKDVSSRRSAALMRLKDR